MSMTTESAESVQNPAQQLQEALITFENFHQGVAHLRASLADVQALEQAVLEDRLADLDSRHKRLLELRAKIDILGTDLAYQEKLAVQHSSAFWKTLEAAHQMYALAFSEERTRRLEAARESFYSLLDQSQLDYLETLRRSINPDQQRPLAFIETLVEHHQSVTELETDPHRARGVDYSFFSARDREKFGADHLVVVAKRLQVGLQWLSSFAQNEQS
jgi:hypothetical protein